MFSQAKLQHYRMLTDSGSPMKLQRTPKRLFYIDNLRYLMVLLVVIVHGACAYANIFPWWCVMEVNEYRWFFNNLMLLLMVFLMPVLYFFAGYFGISSLQRKGTPTFLKNKLLRLGLPLLIIIPIVSPTYSYIYHYTHNGHINKVGFMTYWLTYMKGAFNLQMGVISPIDSFHHSHLWFISLLLFFFILLPLFSPRTLSLKAQDDPPLKTLTAKSLLPAFVLVIIGATLSSFAAVILFSEPFNPDPWVTIGSLLHFQPMMLGSYIIYFSLGVFGFYRKWLTHTKFPGHPLLWATSCILFSIIMITVYQHLMIRPTTAKLLVVLSTRSLLCFLFLITSIQFGDRYWNKSSPLNRQLATHSYTIYLIHFLIVILFQLFLLHWNGGPVFIKFFMVTSGSIIISYLISRYCVKPFPWLSVCVTYVVFLFFLLTIQPTIP